MNTTHRIMINGCKIRLSKYFETNERIIWNYSFTPKGEHKPLFTGHDLSSSHYTSIKHVAYALLSFLTLKQGDVEKEYFKDYTAAQITWSESSACEELSYYVMELEEKEDR